MKKEQIDISWVNPKLEVRENYWCGKGVFTKEDIKKGERIAVFGGYVVSTKELGHLKKVDKKLYSTIFEIGYQVDDDLIFSPTEKTQFSVIEFLDHSCDPNCWFENQLTLVARRNIRANQELTMDYAACMTMPSFKMKCLCKKKNCRKLITGNDWLDTGLQKKYRGHFQPYIGRKIRSLNKENQR